MSQEQNICPVKERSMFAMAAMYDSQAELIDAIKDVSTVCNSECPGRQVELREKSRSLLGFTLSRTVSVEVCGMFSSRTDA